MHWLWFADVWGSGGEGGNHDPQVQPGAASLRRDPGAVYQSGHTVQWIPRHVYQEVGSVLTTAQICTQISESFENIFFYFILSTFKVIWNKFTVYFNTESAMN